ncbi:MAG: type II secretion system F family protein, partial [Clostridiales bacterium]
VSKKQRVLYEGLYQSLLEGLSLSEAMEQAGGAFPPLLINMYKAAEANGTIDLTALRMAEHYEKEYRLKSRLRSASTYPIILLCLTIGVLLVIFTVVLPQFFTMFGDMELPLMTRIMMGISVGLRANFLFILIGVLVAVFGITMLLQNRAVRLFLDQLKLKLPVFGKLLRVIYTARFSRTLSSLYSSGLTILTALQVSRDTIGNLYIADQFDGVIQDVRNGIALSDALEKVDGYDKKLPSTVLIGEESGQLEKMLLSVSDAFDYEADQVTQRLASMLEPMLLILMAVVIGIVMLSVIVPIYNMYGNIGI